MAHTPKLTLVLAGVALLAACGGKPAPEPTQPVSETPVPRAPATQVASPMPSDRMDPNADAWRRTLEERIYFAVDRADLSPQARTALAQKASVLRSAPGITVRIEGHADERGSDEYNLALSKRRAAEAKRYLMQQGIQESRMEIVGYGEEQPLDPASNESAWSMNRRAGFQVTAGTVSQR